MPGDSLPSSTPMENANASNSSTSRNSVVSISSSGGLQKSRSDSSLGPNFDSKSFYDFWVGWDKTLSPEEVRYRLVWFFKGLIAHWNKESIDVFACSKTHENSLQWVCQIAEFYLKDEMHEMIKDSISNAEGEGKEAASCTEEPNTISPQKVLDAMNSMLTLVKANWSVEDIRDFVYSDRYISELKDICGVALYARQDELYVTLTKAHISPIDDESKDPAWEDFCDFLKNSDSERIIGFSLQFFREDEFERLWQENDNAGDLFNWFLTIAQEVPLETSVIGSMIRIICKCPNKSVFVSRMLQMLEAIWSACLEKEAPTSESARKRIKLYLEMVRGANESNMKLFEDWTEHNFRNLLRESIDNSLDKDTKGVPTEMFCQQLQGDQILLMKELGLSPIKPDLVEHCYQDWLWLLLLLLCIVFRV